MFTTVLIANRGAIACRIIRTLRRMGIRSVAVFSEADRQSLHVRQADEAVCIGPAPAAESYLNGARILEVAKQTGAQAIHPGYGFLSENAEFAEACAAAGICFVGPEPAQMRLFGLKHQARELALQHKVPLLPGSPLLDSLAVALQQAEIIGYPVMLKSTAGGGGIGMQLCVDAAGLAAAFHSVERLARSHFSQGGIFLEKFVQAARHIEVQIVGDGAGRVVHLGERDCSVQRRNQKVIEETPAPHISDDIRRKLCDAATALGAAINYRSAGTVEFLYDQQSQAFYFLEVNTRLQVEHGVTEAVTGVDLVEWMLNIAAQDYRCLSDWALSAQAKKPGGHAIQVRLYAEDPGKNFQPSAGLLTEVAFPDNLRVDTWVETGTVVSSHYDPMLGKIIASGQSRNEALQALVSGLAQTRVAGIETNLAYAHQIVLSEDFVAGNHTTAFLNNFDFKPCTIDVIQAGTQTLVVDYPGRIGYWNVGIPPSGPMDDYSHRLANRLLDNAADAAALEITVSGPVLRFNTATRFVLAGVNVSATLDGADVPLYSTVAVVAGSTLSIGSVGIGDSKGSGVRAYLAVFGGFDVPLYMGSKTTFTLGQFGGHGGRALHSGDVLHLTSLANGSCETIKDDDQHRVKTLPAEVIPQYQATWHVRVMYGPHGAPDFFTAADIHTFFSSDYEVHYNSSRTGVRLIGPRPAWARSDGGEAGLHPSNIHDNAYAIGAIDFTGDMPIILGPDGPSLGGFVCPATVIKADLWKIGQLKPGDKLRFVQVKTEQAEAARLAQEAVISRLAPLIVDKPRTSATVSRAPLDTSCILYQADARDDNPAICYRQAGDCNLLVEYGPLALDIALRFRVQALMNWLSDRDSPGVIDLTPGIRSLQVHYDSELISQQTLLVLLRQAEQALGSIGNMEVPSRIVHLPLSWDDPSTQLAIARYSQSVRADAPWCPSNIEFIRRINGLGSVDEVKKIVFDASYLVLGLGDVYLGAPVATPMDPRHRLVTTKYNPARTWTPENAVGIGGAYLCVYGMEGPGGYQFVGRTIQMWNRFRQTDSFVDGKQWLLRFFDQIRFHEVSHEELQGLREDFPLGRYRPRIEETSLNLRQYQQFLADNGTAINAFKQRQQQAFEEERGRWALSGQANFAAELPDELPAEDCGGADIAVALPAGSVALVAAVAGSVWQVQVTAGDKVNVDDSLIVIEAMKMEIPVKANAAGVVTEIICKPGDTVKAGQVLAIIRQSDDINPPTTQTTSTGANP